MRVGVDYRFLSSGPFVLMRGVGRYTQQQLNAVLQADQDNEYLLFCYDDADRQQLDPAVRAAPNATLVTMPRPKFDSGHMNSAENVLRAGEAFQQQLDRHRLDVFHLTIPYNSDCVVPVFFDVCPLVATYYDAIPFVYPRTYFTDPAWSAFYLRVGECIRQARQLIAISRSARRDAQLYLGYPASRIHTAYPVASSIFTAQRSPVFDNAFTGLQTRLRKSLSQYVMVVSYPHHAKNLDTLFKAYMQLPSAIRNMMPLVMAFNIEQEGYDALANLVKKYSVEEHIVLTGLLSDDELVSLYQNATMVVHPSRYEGFGIPVLEAMLCGTPVITTTASSLPEVGGDAAILVNPEDVDALASAIERVYSQSDLREKMRAQGFRQAQRFNAEQLAQATLEAYRSAVEEPVVAKPKKRVAYWSPLPPVRSGIADYSAELLSHLGQHYDIEVFVDDDYLPSNTFGVPAKFHHYSAFERRHRQNPFDLSIYQVGASSFHDYMLSFLVDNPGLSVIHDLDFRSYCFYLLESRAGDGAQVPSSLVSRLRQNRTTEEPDMEIGALRGTRILRWLVEHSLAQGVLFPNAQEHLYDVSGHAQASFLPMGVEDPCQGLLPAKAKLAARAELDIDEDAFVVGVAGIVHPVKRIEQIIFAFERLLHTHANALLLVIGAPQPDEYGQQLMQLAYDRKIADRVVFTGYASGSLFNLFLNAVDVLANLRFPSKLQMSAVLARAIAAGKPCIITDLPEWRFLPESFCIRVAADSGEVMKLSHHLQRLASNPRLIQNMGDQARAYFEASGSLKLMAVEYARLIERLTHRSFPVHEPTMQSVPYEPQ